MIRYITILVFLLCLSNVSSQTVLIDGFANEWSESDLIVEDTGDQAGLEIENVWIRNDEEYLFIRFDVSEEIIIQRNSNFVLIIDADNDLTTGFPIKGLGTEFSFYFDNNNGFVNYDFDSYAVIHDDVGFYIAPAFESTTFEIAISRSLGGFGAFIADEIKLAIFEDEPGGDIAPNDPTNMTFNLDPDQLVESPEYSFTQPAGTDFRMLSMNVLRDEIFEASAFDAYNRVLDAIKPDIIAFQEIYDHSSLQTRNLVEEFLPSEAGELWFHEKIGADIILISRYPIIFDDWVDGNGAFVLDVDGKEVLVFNVHFPCCENDAERHEEIDALLAYMRDMINGDGPYNLDENSPFFVVGDFNLVGSGDQLNNLLTGNIRNNTFFGPDFDPDWKDGPLTDVRPAVAGTNLSYSWYNPFSNFTGGRLDFNLFSSSSIYLQNSFVLDTRQLSQADLFLNNLSQNDSEICSDHLPVVSDWSFNPIVIPLTAEVDIKHIDCFGENTGELIVHASGGTEPYVYQIDNQQFQDDPLFSDLYEGDYLITIEDAADEMIELEIRILENEQITAILSTEEDSLYITTNGGVPPYQYSIDNGASFQNDPFFANLEEGEYELIIRDSLGCVRSDDFTIILNSVSDNYKSKPSIFPNPASDLLYLKDPDSHFNQLKIFNSNGKILESLLVGPAILHAINIKDLNPGVYMLSLSSSERTIVLKFIKV